MFLKSQFSFIASFPCSLIYNYFTVFPQNTFAGQENLQSLDIIFFLSSNFFHFLSTSLTYRDFITPPFYIFTEARNIRFLFVFFISIIQSQSALIFTQNSTIDQVSFPYILNPIFFQNFPKLEELYVYIHFSMTIYSYVLSQ